MSCFENLIGLKNSCLSNPKSSLWINDLGINNVLLDQYAGSNYQSGVDLFRNKLEFAGNVVANDILTRLNNKLRGTSLKSNINIGFQQEPYTQTTAALGAGNWVGVRIKQDINSFIELFVNTISILLTTDVEKEFKIFDFKTKKEIATYTVNSNEISDIQKSLESLGRDIDVVLVYESIEVAKRTIVRDGYCGECGGGASYISCGNYTEVVGVKVTLDGSGNIATLTNVPYTYGLQVNYNLSCSYKSWLCSISNLIALPVLYRLAAEINEYAIHIAPNDKVNNSVEGVDRLKSAYTYYMEEYSKSIDNVIKNMFLPPYDDCFNCRENLRYQVTTP